jgi:hypothetical protein
MARGSRLHVKNADQYGSCFSRRTGRFAAESGRSNHPSYQPFGKAEGGRPLYPLHALISIVYVWETGA